MENLKKYNFKVYYFNPTTKKIELTSKMKTKPISPEKLMALINLELQKNKNSCYEIL